MDLKSLLREEIKREHEYLEGQEVGSEEYSASWKRLSNLQDKLINLEKITSESEVKGNQMELEIKKFEFEAEHKRKLTKLEIDKFEFETEIKNKQMNDDKKDRLVRTIIEGVKIGTGVVVPIIGLVWITAAEKEITFTGALKGYASLFVPKKIM